jgi:mRNA interferase MazF
MAVVKAKFPKRGDIYLVGLDPTRGTEMKKTRPCVVVSPDELNAHLQTTIVAPLTTAGKPYPFRIQCQFDGKKGQIVIDQIRTIDRERLLKRLGRLPETTLQTVLAVLREMFSL